MITIAFLAVAFLAGALISVLTLVVLSVHREERGGSLPHRAPTRGTKAARVLMGLRVCDPGNAIPTRLPTRPARPAPPDPAHHHRSPV